MNNIEIHHTAADSKIKWHYITKSAALTAEKK